MHTIVVGAAHCPHILTIDLAAHVVRVGARNVDLSAREFVLLEHLGLCKNTLVTNDLLYASIYGKRNSLNINTLRALVSRLRRRICKFSGGIDYIRVVTNEGYILSDDPPETFAAQSHDLAA